jgi:hypothetical protein
LKKKRCSDVAGFVSVWGEAVIATDDFVVDDLAVEIGVF